MHNYEENLPFRLMLMRYFCMCGCGTLRGLLGVMSQSILLFTCIMHSFALRHKTKMFVCLLLQS